MIFELVGRSKIFFLEDARNPTLIPVVAQLVDATIDPSSC